MAAGLAFLALVGVGQCAAADAKSGTVSVVQKELARRQARLHDAQVFISEADAHFMNGNDEEAMRLYRQAYDSVPVAPMTEDVRNRARDGYSKAANRHAKKLAAEARYSDARLLLQNILAADFDPKNEEAKKFTEQLADPDRFEPALTPEHLRNAETVQKTLRMANSYFDLGDYDNAIAQFQAVLRIDAYNSAARQGMERSEEQRAKYFETARDQRRASALTAVDAMWEEAVPVSDVSGLFGGSAGMGGAIGLTGGNVLARLKELVIPRVDLQGASLEEVMEFLRIRSRELDPQKRGVDFILKVSDDIKNKPITLSLQSVPLEEALRYATEQADAVYRLDDHAVIITSPTERSDTLLIRSYRVPPDFISNTPIDNAGAGADPFALPGVAAAGGGMGRLQVRRLTAKEFLEQRGVPFPEGASANFNTSNSVLTVRNTVENMAYVDVLVEKAASTIQKQVEIQVRMVEVSQTNDSELGFDWLLGEFDVPGSGTKLFASGGTGIVDGTDYPGNTADGSVIGSHPVTSNLRGISATNSAQSIDSLIGRADNSAAGKTPGAFSVIGAFTDPQFQLVLRAMSQKKGLDLMASPSVITKNAQRASVRVVREFIYPTEFEPPQIPQQVASGSYPVTPSTPGGFEMREVGIILEVEPVVSDNNRTVELSITPSSTEFEGFIDYGSDINGAATDAFGNPTTYTIENQILQPVFRSNKVNTNVTVDDGQTVILGGLMSEQVQTIDDKVPVLGDLPVIGRAFQSKVRSTVTKNVLFFVTVKVIDPGGHRLVPSGEATAAR